MEFWYGVAWSVTTDICRVSPMVTVGCAPSRSSCHRPGVPKRLQRTFLNLDAVLGAKIFFSHIQMWSVKLSTPSGS